MSRNKTEKEVRFAVVMYGGGSLAIYINGIAQELLKMVRATTVEDVKPYGELQETEKIYRKVAVFLSDKKFRAEIDKLETEWKQLSKEQQDRRREQYRKKTQALFEPLHKNSFSVRFIVDVLSGSSAGGINAVFLAKALANNQEINDLKDLWLLEGDFAKLINDRKSVDGLGLVSPAQPESLLNSQRMYAKLLAALDQMDTKFPASKKSPNVEELDMFVTVTDFTGVPVPIRLFDRIVKERRHKQFFHFKFNQEAGKANPFIKDNNPFLAFAARSTSAFPLAFEPMSLADIDEVIDRCAPLYESGNSKSDSWLTFFAGFKAPREEIKALRKKIKKSEERFTLDQLKEQIKTREKNLTDPEIDEKAQEALKKQTEEQEKEINELRKIWNKSRYLVDGGALDNKPFSFAIETLLKRQSDVPVDRKLVYVEPTPEIFSLTNEVPEKPNALENLFGQGAELPQYETIREDLQALINRNRLIERINRLIKNAEKDKTLALLSVLSKNPQTLLKLDVPAKKWEKYTFDDIVRRKGRAYLPYYRLRVIAVTDDIARLITKLVGFDDQSDYFIAIRSLVRGWREFTYNDYSEDKEAAESKDKKSADTKHKNNGNVEELNPYKKLKQKLPDLKPLEDNDPETINSYLYRFDVNFYFRRLRFVLQKAAQLYSYEPDLQKHLEFRARHEQLIRDKNFPDFDRAEVRQYYGLEEKIYYTLDKKIVSKTPSEIIFNEIRANPDLQNDLRRIVAKSQREINQIYKDLRNKEQALYDGKSSDEHVVRLKEALRQIKLTSYDLNHILGQNVSADGDVVFADYDEEAFFAQAIDKLEGNNDYALYLKLRETAERLKEYYKKSFFEIARNGIHSRLKTNINSNNPLPEIDSEELLFEAVRGYLWHCYDNFDDYDQISFPIFYETAVGEADVVDILRISPQDAESLIDEKTELAKEGKNARRKLAGGALYGFGAFLDDSWRQNDIMWGRLDGAERLITGLLPPGDKYTLLRETLVKEAHETILRIELGDRNTQELRGEMLSALLQSKAANSNERTIARMIAEIENSALKRKLGNILTTCLEEKEIYPAFKKLYEVDRRLEPKDALRILSRSTQVTGKILEKIAEDDAKAGSRLSWIARLGQIFWGLVEVAAPNSLSHLLFVHWLKLLYFFEMVLILGSTLLVKTEIQQFGIVALVLTAVIHLTVIFFHDKMLGDKFGRNLARFFIGGVLAIFAGAGFLLFYGVFFDAAVWKKIAYFQNFAVQYERWKMLLPIVPFAILFVLLIFWREIEKLNLPLIGRAIIVGFAATFLLNLYFVWLTTGEFFADSPIIELEFVRNADQLGAVIKNFGKYKPGVKTTLWWDSLVFVPLYWSFLVMLSGLLKRRQKTWTMIGAVLAALCATGAAIADWSENYFSLVALNRVALNRNISDIIDKMVENIVLTDKAAENIVLAAYVKWSLIFFACGILSGIFWRRRLTLWNIVAVLLVIMTATGIIGTFYYPLSFAGMPLVTIALISEFLILVIVGVAFQFKRLRDDFLRQF